MNTAKGSRRYSNGATADISPALKACTQKYWPIVAETEMPTASVQPQASGQRQMREVRACGSYLSSSDPRLHFGLGEAARVDLLEVRWPNGETEIVREVPVDRVATIREGQGIQP